MAKKKPIYWTDWNPGGTTNKDLLKTSCPPWLMDALIEDSKETLGKLGLSNARRTDKD